MVWATQREGGEGEKQVREGRAGVGLWSLILLTHTTQNSKQGKKEFDCSGPAVACACILFIIMIVSIVFGWRALAGSRVITCGALIMPEYDEINDVRELRATGCRILVDVEPIVEINETCIQENTGLDFEEWELGLDDDLCLNYRANWTSCASCKNGMDLDSWRPSFLYSVNPGLIFLMYGFGGYLLTGIAAGLVFACRTLVYCEGQGPQESDFVIGCSLAVATFLGPQAVMGYRYFLSTNDLVVYNALVASYSAVVSFIAFILQTTWSFIIALPTHLPWYANTLIIIILIVVISFVAITEDKSKAWFFHEWFFSALDDLTDLALVANILFFGGGDAGGGSVPTWLLIVVTVHGVVIGWSGQILFFRGYLNASLLEETDQKVLWGLGPVIALGQVIRVIAVVCVDTVVFVVCLCVFGVRWSASACHWSVYLAVGVLNEAVMTLLDLLKMLGRLCQFVCLVVVYLLSCGLMIRFPEVVSDESLADWSRVAQFLDGVAFPPVSLLRYRPALEYVVGGSKYNSSGLAEDSRRWRLLRLGWEDGVELGLVVVFLMLDGVDVGVAIVSGVVSSINALNLLLHVVYHKKDAPAPLDSLV